MGRTEDGYRGLWTRREVLVAGTAAALATAGSAAPPAAARPGAFTTTTVSDGGFPLPLAMLTRDRDPGEVTTLLREAGLPTDEHATVLNVTLLSRGDQRVVVDCGAGPNFMPGAGKLGEALAAAGVAPESVSHVLLTHAHPDHLWGALDDFDTPAFPQATYHIARAERDFWFRPDVMTLMPADRQAFAAGAQRVLKRLEPVLRTFEPGDEPVAGIAAVPTPGHTPGHTAFELRDAAGPLIVLGDAVTHAAISFQRPDWPGGFDMDAGQASATRRRLLEKAVADKAIVVGYHLPQGGAGRVERAGSAYRFVQS